MNKGICLCAKAMQCLRGLPMRAPLSAEALRALKALRALIAIVAMALLVACGSSKHVPEGKYLLNKVKVTVDDTLGNKDIRSSEMINYVRQLPNHKILWSWKMQLGIYNLSGKDSTKWINRQLRKMGEPPVIYDSALTDASVHQLRQALVNKGYLSAEVWADTVMNRRKKKATVNYTVRPGEPHIIKSIDYVFPNDTLRDLILADSLHFTIKPGDPLDHQRLESLRDVMQHHLRNRGYYAFGKEFITFSADTTAGSRDVDLTVIVNPASPAREGMLYIPTHETYRVRSVRYITDYNPVTDDNLRAVAAQDTVLYKDIVILYNGRKYLRPTVLYENCFIRAGEPYRLADVSATYQALSRLGILKFINVRFLPVEGGTDGVNEVDAYILLTPDKSQSFSVELEGTNSEGDLGVAVGLGYTHRNIGKGSETLTTKLRGAYESLNGNLEGFIHDRYMEYTLDAAISFPKFKFPFLHEDFKRKIHAATEFNVAFNYQERPEYTRIIATAGWSYKWMERQNRNRHTFTPIDINYIYLPESTNDFINQIAPDNPLLRYSYEDHFIMRLGYTFYHTNKRRDTPWTRGFQSNIYTVRVSAETAGNFLFVMSSIFAKRHNFREDPYKIFGIRYSQYIKGEVDYTLLHNFDIRNALAFHTRFGIAYPYGNSTILPFEKRFYGGGANGVRGWAVRTLGPGSYPGNNSVSSFINQCGDITLEMNLEYRAKLFWLIELAAFIDAGNIWTIHNYENQPGGMFHFNTFYKQIAAAYGLGIRLDFSYFLLRFDLGMKAHNPAMGAEPWPLIHPNWKRDSSFHFSIGYPF